MTLSRNDVHEDDFGASPRTWRNKRRLLFQSRVSKNLGTMLLEVKANLTLPLKAVALPATTCHEVLVFTARSQLIRRANRYGVLLVDHICLTVLWVGPFVVYEHPLSNSRFTAELCLRHMALCLSAWIFVQTRSHETRHSVFRERGQRRRWQCVHADTQKPHQCRQCFSHVPPDDPLTGGAKLKS